MAWRFSFPTRRTCRPPLPPAGPTGGSGYEVEVYASDGSRIACQTQAQQAAAMSAPADRKVQHFVQARAGDAQIYALEEAHRIRIMLPGAYHQIWLRDIA